MSAAQEKAPGTDNWGYDDDDNPCMMTAGKDGDGHNLYVAEVWHDEHKALLAAAPELLEACQAAIDEANGEYCARYLELAAAAIAAATGE